MILSVTLVGLSLSIAGTTEFGLELQDEWGKVVENTAKAVANAVNPEIPTRVKRGAGSKLAARVGWKLAEFGLDAVSSVRAAIGINIVTNCVKTAIDYFNPNSVPNRVGRLEDALERSIRNQDLIKETLDILVNTTYGLNQRTNFVERYSKHLYDNAELLHQLRTVVLDRLRLVYQGLLQMVVDKTEGSLSSGGMLDECALRTNCKKEGVAIRATPVKRMKIKTV